MCRGQSRCLTSMKRLDKFTDELFKSPTFPLLYITKTTELATLAAFGHAPPEAAAIMAVASVPATYIWYSLGDKLDDTIDEVAEDMVNSED